MKFTCSLLLILFTSFNLSSQNDPGLPVYKNSLGMDVFPFFGTLFDGNINFLEFSYVRTLKKIDLRAKINFDQNRSLDVTVLRRVDIDPENNLSFSSTYQENHTVHLSLGATKRMKMGSLDYYFGVDGDFGFKSGESTALIFNEEMEEMNELVGRVKSTHHFVGITPILGATIPLMPRVVLAVELGVPLVYTFGEIGYLTEDADRLVLEISNKQAKFNRLLNDVRISFLF